MEPLAPSDTNPLLQWMHTAVLGCGLVMAGDK